jgi:hypothetical protein
MNSSPLAQETPIRRIIHHHVLTFVEESWTCLCVRTNRDFISDDCNCGTYGSWSVARRTRAAVMFFRTDSLDNIQGRGAIIARFIKCMYKRSIDLASEGEKVCRYVQDCLCVYDRTPLLLVTPDDQHVIHAIQLIGSVFSPSTRITVSRKRSAAEYHMAYYKIKVRDAEPSARMSIPKKRSVLLKRHPREQVFSIIEPVKETDVFTEKKVAVIELQDGINESCVKMTVTLALDVVTVPKIEIEPMWTVDQEGIIIFDE